ncbi:MAG TPA: hypothetical protein VMV69_27055 [Pirellulales bacterium]|nr:hypothetical protein [Pirellulales bacterium]
MSAEHSGVMQASFSGCHAEGHAANSSQILAGERAGQLTNPLASEGAHGERNCDNVGLIRATSNGCHAEGGADNGTVSTRDCARRRRDTVAARSSGHSTFVPMARAALLFVATYALAVTRTDAAQPPADTDAENETEGVPDEPTSVTLADGTVLELETYGDSYEGYEPRLPITAEKAETLVDYGRDRLGGNLELRSIRLDVKKKRMYWIDTDGGAWRFGNIRSAGLNGKSPSTLVGPKLADPRGLELDLVHRMMYWSNAVPSETHRMGVQRAKLDGSRHATLIDVPSPGAPSAVAIDADADSDTLYYFDDAKLVRARLDGSNEEMVVEASGKAHFGWSAVIDHARNQLYWAGGDDRITRVNLDGTRLETVVALGLSWGQIWGIALDAANDKLYWIERSYGHVCRANLDGSQIENLVVGLEWPGGVDVDLGHGHVYWTDRYNDGGTLYGLVQRAKLPPVPTPKTMRAPPRVVAMEPARGAAGIEVTLRGTHFTGVERAEFIGDGGERLRATYIVKSDGELRVVVPKAPKGVKRAAIVVAGPGGVTVTLPRDCRGVKGDKIKFDRFHDAHGPPYVVASGSRIAHIEKSLAIALDRARITTGGRGGNVLFMKNGSSMVPHEGSTNVIYQEPFARLAGRHKKASPGTALIRVPAIRLSFVESLFEYDRQ